MSKGFIWFFVLAIGILSGILITLFTLPVPKPVPIVPIVHDVCRAGVKGPACHTVAFWPGMWAVSGGEVTALQPDGSVVYLDEVMFVARCTENCEVK